MRSRVYGALGILFGSATACLTLASLFCATGALSASSPHHHWIAASITAWLAIAVLLLTLATVTLEVRKRP